MGMSLSALAILYCTRMQCPLYSRIYAKISRVGTNKSSQTEIRLIIPPTDCFGALIGMRNVCLISVPFWFFLRRLSKTLHLMFYVSR